MTAFLALFRKNLLDSRWLLGSLSAALFGLCWLSVNIASRIEKQMQLGGGAGMRMMRGRGGPSMDFSSVSLEVMFWRDPPFLLILAIWAIARGSIAVSGEIEKGTMDLVLSRPVPRVSFLLAQVASSLLGFLVMCLAMLAGHRVGTHYNTLINPPAISLIAQPLVNYLALGFAIYGYTFLLSTFDLVRWRPNLIASVVTLAGFIAQIVANLPTMEDYKWLEKLSIFKAYDPVEVVTKGQNLDFNLGILGIIAAIGIIIGMVLFSRRDIPAGS